MLLFGGSGLLGTRIKELLKEKYTIISPTHAEVDLLAQRQVENTLGKKKYDVIVYAAGITSIDNVEQDKEYAMKLNRDVVVLIAKHAARMAVPLVYFSTDAVFKGDRSESPYTESDGVNPLNYYGLTKAEGEQVVLSASAKNLVIRLITLYTSFFSHRLDFARLVIAKLAHKETCYGISDQFYNPTFSDDAVQALFVALQKKVSGIFHAGATDYMTNYDFSRTLARTFHYDEKSILPITLAEFVKGKTVNRAQFPWLDTKKTQTILGSSVLHTNRQNISILHAQMLHV